MGFDGQIDCDGLAFMKFKLTGYSHCVDLGFPAKRSAIEPARQKQHAICLPILNINAPGLGSKTCSGLASVPTVAGKRGRDRGAFAVAADHRKQ